MYYLVISYYIQLSHEQIASHHTDIHITQSLVDQFIKSCMPSISALTIFHASGFYFLG